MDYDTQAQLSDLKARVAALEETVSAILEHADFYDETDAEPEPVLESMHTRFLGRIRDRR